MVYNKYFLSKARPKLCRGRLRKLVQRALREDIGSGDITTQLLIPRQKKIQAKIIAKENFLLCGIAAAEAAFKIADPGLKFEQKIKEGAEVRAKDVIAVISGRASSILKAERLALNLLALLSGVAKKTQKFVKKIKPFKTKITDTRKTLPGLRELQKYAVRIGGGYNHRLRLDEMVLIKDNHLKILGKFSTLPKVPAGCKIEIEAQSLEEFRHALSFEPDVIMLDNMSIPDIKRAVTLRDSIPFKKQRTILEASGGIHLGNLKKYAATGVDLISIGELTDSLESVDISLEVI